MSVVNSSIVGYVIRLEEYTPGFDGSIVHCKKSRVAMVVVVKISINHSGCPQIPE